MKYGCCVKRQLKGKLKRDVSKKLKKVLEEKGIEVNEKSQICNQCRLSKTHVKLHVQPCTKVKANQASVSLPFVSAGKSNSKCAFCNSKTGLRVIPKEARTDAFTIFSILVPVGCKCSPKHLIGKNMNPNQTINTMSYRKQHSPLTSEEITDLLSRLKSRAILSSMRGKIDFDVICEEDHHSLLGISKDSFNDLTSSIISLKKSRNRSIKNAVGILLFKLKSGLSNGLLATLCGLSSRRQVAEIVKRARVALVRDFVPLNVGFHHLTREHIIDRLTTDISKQLFSDPISDTVILVLDGTYIYIQKSSSYKFQRLTYSVYKGRPLVKPFIITTTDGYIVDVVGPFFSNGRNMTQQFFLTLSKQIKGISQVL